MSDRVYLLGWLRELGANWAKKSLVSLTNTHPVDSPRFSEAYQDDSDKVENDESLQKYKEGIDFGCVIGHGPLEAMKLN